MSQKHKKLSFKTPSAFIASLRPLVVGEINAEMLLEPAKPAALNNTVNWEDRSIEWTLPCCV